ncbi:uncharacterized protein APUU_41418S [Aspergillus puulaauensis]|uniref:Uncharacterized protein n=1 Tax=Aspergillus puulaauensis TaxID=1220207 RepID=A0A7R7XQL1_9EURO|nr:uncharacterized protein APUU_41418S [Aspergillus puulaauensis]BCS24974.1 hypothetical protein APUU_41418S [Aspergillus puulaauensis]
MKLTSTIISVLLATSASAVLDKWAPWGKRDYACINAYSGPTDNSTIAPNWPIEIRFNRNSGRCDASLDHYPTAEYSLWLHNNPVRQPAGFVTSEYQVKLQDGIPSDAGSVTFELPDDLPEVGDDSVWYLRLNTYLPTAPQMPSLFNALGPFRLVR